MGGLFDLTDPSTGESFETRQPATAASMRLMGMVMSSPEPSIDFEEGVKRVCEFSKNSTVAEN